MAKAVAVFFLGLVWFVIFGVYAIVTLPILTFLMVGMIGCDILGDHDASSRWRDRIDILFIPPFWLGELGLRWIRRGRPV